MFEWLRRKRDRREDNEGHHFTEEERDKSHISLLENSIRKQRIKFLKDKLERIKQAQEVEQLEAQVSDAEDAFYGEEEEETPAGVNPDAMLMGILSQILTPKTEGSQEVNNPAPLSKKTLSDEQLRDFKAQIPKAYIKKLKGLNDDAIIALVSSYKPEFIQDYTDDTIMRAITILKE